MRREYGSLGGGGGCIYCIADFLYEVLILPCHGVTVKHEILFPQDVGATDCESQRKERL